MKKPNIISIVNQKGGTGKTTTALNIYQALKKKGYKTLLIDLDAQANATDQFISVNPKYNIYDVLIGKADINQAIERSKNGDFIASSYNLSVFDIVLSGNNKDKILRNALNGLKSEYDYIIIDNPPVLNLLTINSLTACDHALIVAQADIFSYKSICQIMETIKSIQKNNNFNVLGIVLTRYNGRTIITQTMTQNLSQLATQCNTTLLNTFIRENSSIKETQALKQNLFDYAPKSNGAKDYIKLTDEILSMINKENN